MFRTRSVTRSALVVPALLALPLALVACGDDGDDATITDSAPVITDAAPATGDAPAADCPPPFATSVDAASQPGEPTVSIPVPDGWEEDADLAQGDDEIRLILVESGKDWQDAGMATVMFQDSDLPQQEAVEQLVSEGIADDDSISDSTRQDGGELCGFPVVRLDYLSEAYSGAQDQTPVDATTVILGVPDDDGTTVIAVTVLGGADAADQIIDGVTVTTTD